MSQTLVASLGFLAGVVAAMIDGPRSVPITGLVAGLLLAPAAMSVAGGGGALVVVGAGVAATVAGLGARRAAEAVRSVPGLDPDVPVVSPRDELFGPRSVRAAGAVLALAAASWVSLNAEVGGVATDQGAVFAATFVWLIGAIRLLRGRSLEDLAIGVTAIALAGATGWILQVGSAALPEAATVAGLASLAAVVTGWLSGRHHHAVRRARAPL